MGWPSGPVSTLNRMDLTSHTTDFSPGKTPQDEALGRFAPLLALTLLLPLPPPFLPAPEPRHTPHLPFSIPSPLLRWLWSHQTSPLAKAIDSSDPRHPFLQQQKCQIVTSFPKAAKPSLPPVHPPWLLPSATSALSSGRKPSLHRWGLFPADPAPGPSTEPKLPNTAVGVGAVHLLMNSEQHFPGILYSLKLYSSCLCFFPDWRKGLNVTVSWNESQINFHFPKDRFSPRQVVEICNSLLKRGSFTSGQYHVLSGCHQRSWKVAYS